jgi:hypothetical protein
MLWANNTDILRELHDERVRQHRHYRTTRKPRLKLVALEKETDA